jgi:CAAX prenyl protease-like protein
MTKSYVLPFLAYVLGAGVAASLPAVYPLAYAAVVALVTAATWYLLRGRQIFVPHWRVGEAIAVGLVGIALWIGLSDLGLEKILAQFLPEWLRPGSRPAYNPFEALTQPIMAWGFIGVRMIGLVILVPIAEELFWRGFLSRWLISAEWEAIPLGRFTGTSFALVALLFTAAHPEWLAAVVYCTLLNGLLWWKKDLWSCIVAHGVSNLALGFYILATGAWWLW